MTTRRHLMRITRLLILLMGMVMTVMCPTHAQYALQGQKAESRLLAQWQAGASVSADVLKSLGDGVSQCFKAEEISDSVFRRMQGKSYPQGCTVPRSELRYLKVLHWDIDGKVYQGEMVCNRLIADDLIAIFRQLYEAHYPIHRMVLIDDYDADDETSMQANNSTCFCYRKVAGSTKLSKHAQGLAVDINPLYNPCEKRRADGSRHVQPSTAAGYCDRSKSFPYKIDRQDLCYRLFIAHGFRWGGAWKSVKDYQHFER